MTADVARVYAVVARALRAKGRLIGANDLWIACTAKAVELPLVTRNGDHFRRVRRFRDIVRRISRPLQRVQARCSAAGDVKSCAGASTRGHGRARYSTAPKQPCAQQL